MSGFICILNKTKPFLFIIIFSLIMCITTKGNILKLEFTSDVMTIKIKRNLFSGAEFRHVVIKFKGNHIL